MRCCCEPGISDRDFFSGKGASGRGLVFYMKNPNGEVRSQPGGAKKQNNAEKNFRTHGDGTLNGGLNRRDFQRGVNEGEHRGESHGNNQNRSQDGSEEAFHFCAMMTAISLAEKRGRGLAGEIPCKRFRPLGFVQRKPDQSSATKMESTGLDGSYLILAGWPATRRSRRIWLSRPVMSCAVWYVTPEMA